jgi:hypothetical protein
MVKGRRLFIRGIETLKRQVRDVRVADLPGAGHYVFLTSAIIVVSLLLTAEPAAQPQSAVDGSWQAEVPVPEGGTIRFLLVFNTNGRELTGTLTLGDSPPLAIEDGRVRDDGDVITFNRTSTADALDKILFIGKVLNDDLVFAFTRVRGPLRSDTIHFTATRIKS